MEPESSYRRGTVFGLTVAEIFILLIFLILLALLGLANHWEEKNKEYEDERKGREQLLDEWRDVIEFRRPDEIRTLIRKAPELERENVDLREERDALRTQRDELERQLGVPGEELKALQRLRGENTTLSRENEKLREERDELERRMETARRDADDARKELRIQRKGEKPPCWYETVPTGDGGTREKPQYTFDIAVYDDAMVVRRHPVPSGGAEDDGGPPYSEEAERLDLDDRIPYHTRLSYEEVKKFMEPIRDLGWDGKVRSYPCIFWVKVWDKTSPDAKARWQHAHYRVLEELFGTYVAQNEWPGDS